VEIINPGKYEDVMRTRMAANDLPDLFTTHGWSVLRYSEFLEPLNNQPWAHLVCPSIRPVIENDRGQIFVLPFDVDSAGVAFNAEMLERLNIDPFSLTTWDRFIAACERVRDAGFIPVHIGGNVNDNWTVGNFYDWVAPSFLITDDRNNHRAALINGTFDWNLWRPVAQILVDFRDRGFLNPDYTQGTWDDVQRQFGQGRVAFAFFGRYVITGALEHNPNGRFGFIPVPAHFPGDTPTFITGENLAMGVWRNSPNKEEALRFLNWLSQPRIVNRLAQYANNSTGLVGPGYGIDYGPLSKYFAHAANFRGFPYFDRAYLPRGMWDSMCLTGIGLLANTMTMDQVINKMRDDYNNFLHR
jgi:raffinose/stachyose/melibiose transport system substrate-binding protein